MRRLTLRRRRDERGYVAVTTGLLLIVLMAFCAFAVDVGNWYLTGQRAQRAADAAALGGVVSLPGDQPGAFSLADQYASNNGFRDDAVTSVTPSLGGGPTRLRVEVTRTVDNIFGPLLGRDRTSVTRYAVADYAGPVPMGSPCNVYGNDPEASSGTRGRACDAVEGNFWANVNSPSSEKQNGDSYSSRACSTVAAGRDGCVGPTNNEFDDNGYFYTVSVKRASGPLTIAIFDPVAVNVGLTCGFSGSDPGANFGSGATAATRAVNPYHASSGSSGDRYARVPAGDSGSDAWRWCTGDNLYGGSTTMSTRFTVRAPGASAWNPLSGSTVCSRTFDGHTGNLYNALHASSAGYRPDIAEGFRRWVTLCTIAAPEVGDYSVQVTSNVGGTPNDANGGNRYAIRAVTSDLDAVSVSGRQRMGMFANKNGSRTNFHLARLPSGTTGGTLRVALYDVGDSNRTGTIRINPPGGGTYRGCTGSGVTTLIGSDCSFTVIAGSPSIFNGRHQVVNVPVPEGYSCDDRDPTDCWVTLSYDYGFGAQPTDVTTWSASLDGDPIRLIE